MASKARPAASASIAADQDVGCPRSRSSMAVTAIGPVVATLTDMARNHTGFTVAVSEKTGTDWTFSNIAFNDCYITSVANNIIIDGVPTTTFNCICLDVIPTAAT